MAGAQLSQLAMTTTDVLYVGRLGIDSALASMSVGQASYGILLSFGIGLIAAVNPLVSQAHGAGDRKAAQQALALGLGCALFYGFTSWLILGRIDLLYSQLHYPPQVAGPATQYVHWLMFGLPAFFSFLAIKNYLDSTSRPRLPFFIAFLAVGINVVLDYAFVYGRLGLPAWGMVGVGIATSSVNWIMALSMFALISKELEPNWWRPNPGDIKHFLTLALPTAFALLMEVSLFAAAALMMGVLGTDEAAAHQIVVTCTSATFMVPLGISFAGATRVGQAIGAHRFYDVRRAGLAAIFVGTATMLLSGTAFSLLPNQIVSLFWDPAQGGGHVRTFAVDLLLIASIFQFFDGMQITSASALRGMKDVKVPLALAFTSYWLVGLSTSLTLAFATPLRHRGVWIGLLAGLACAALLLLLRFMILSTRLSKYPQVPSPRPD